MKSVGEILKNARIKNNLTTSQVASLIKTKDKYISAIEENHFAVFPGEIYALSFVRDYAEILGLNPDEITPYFRRTIEISRQKQPLVKNEITYKTNFLEDRIDSAGKNISKTILTIGTMIITLVFILFLVFEYQRNILRPDLSIIYPPKDIKTSKQKIIISGKTDSENRIFVNGQEVEVQKTGEFSIDFSLKKGINKISIKAVNGYQKLTEIDRFVLRKE